MAETWSEWADKAVERLTAGPEESAVYAAKVALTGLLDRDGVSCPPAAVIEALAALLEERPEDDGNHIVNGSMVLDLQKLAAKWRGRGI